MAALALLAFLFLLLQLMVGFSLESRAVDQVKAQTHEMDKDKKPDEKLPQEVGDLSTAIVQGMVQHTSCFQLVVFLQIVAVAGGGLLCWLDHRGDKPLPRIDVSW